MKYNYVIAALSAVLLLVSSCQVQELPEKVSGYEDTYMVHFYSNEIASKTVFGDPVDTGDGLDFPTRWSGNEDKIAVSVNLSGARGATVTNVSQDGTHADFDAEFPSSELEAPYVFYALSPFSACVGATSSHGGYHLNILTEQTPLATSCDEGAQLLVASQTAESIADFSNVELLFKHVTAYGQLTLKNMSIADDDEILSIDITASEPFAGQYYYNFADNALSESAASRTITIKPEKLQLTEGDFLQVRTFNMSDIWFACAPCDLGGGTIKVVVNLASGKLTREVSIPEGRLSFNAGRISKFTVNMQTAVFEQAQDRWVRVTDASTLGAGDEIIITNSGTAGAAYAISTTQNDNYRGYTSVTLAQEGNTVIIKNPSDQVEHFILVAGSGNYSSCFRFKDATDTKDGFLAAPNSGNNNYLQTGTNNNDYSNWVITISNNQAVISTYGTVRYNIIFNHYRHIRFNSDRFATYRSSSRTSWDSTTTGTQGTYIFRKEAGINTDDDPILQYDNYGAYLDGGNHVYASGDQLSREYKRDGTVTFAIITPSTFEVSEFNGIPASPAKGDTFTLNYNRMSGRNSSDSDYNVTVQKVDGAKVWLSLGSGNGFIVKK